MTGFKSSCKTVHGICINTAGSLLKGMLYPSGTKKVTLCCTNSSRGLQPHPHSISIPISRSDVWILHSADQNESGEASRHWRLDAPFSHLLAGRGQRTTRPTAAVLLLHFIRRRVHLFRFSACCGTGAAASCKPGRPAGLHPQLRSTGFRGILTIHFFCIIFYLRYTLVYQKSMTHITVNVPR